MAALPASSVGAEIGPKAESTDVQLDIRQTPEYAAAWDLELWRAMQMSKMQKELRERERKLMEEMKLRVQQKEKSDLAQVEKRMRDCAAREATLAKSMEALEKRKNKLKETELELRKQLDETDAFRKRLEEESDARVARVKDEVTHKLELQHQRLVEAQEQIARSDERAANAQKEYLKLWDEFSDFKTRLLSQSGPQLAQQLDAMRAQQEANMLMLVERYDRRTAEMQHQHAEDLRAAHNELKKCTEQLAVRKEQVKATAQQLATVTEERDSARGEVRRLSGLLQQAEAALTSMQSQLHQQHQQGTHGAGALSPERRDAGGVQPLRASIDRALKPHGGLMHSHVAAPHASGQRGDSAIQAAARRDIARWTAERDSLLRDCGGVYDTASPVVVDLEQRIRGAMQMLVTSP